MSLLLSLWPGTTVDRAGATWRARRPDGRIMNAALSPDSEYDSAIRDLGIDGIHQFGEQAYAYLWGAAPGMVRIDVDEKRDFLLLSQVEYADNERDAQAAYDHALRAPWVDASPTHQYRVTLGLWSLPGRQTVPATCRRLSAMLILDMDDTLIRSVGKKRIPMPSVVADIKMLYDGGTALYLWSSGGGDYARASAIELKIEHLFIAFLPKPD